MCNNEIKPNSITFDLTDRCQLKCKTCLKWKTKASDVIDKELTTEEWKKVIFEIREWLGEYCCIYFSGGEPFLREDIFELIEYASSLNINVGSMTNAYSIEHLYDKIANSKLKYLSLSLNAITDENIHDTSRGRENSYKKCIDAIKNLNELIKDKEDKLKINLATILFKENINEAIKLVEFVKENNLDGISFQLIDDLDVFHAFYTQKFIDTKNYKMKNELIEEYKNISKNGIKIIDKLIEMKNNNYPIYNSVEQLKGIQTLLKDYKKIVKQIKCNVGNTNIAIDPYGDIRLCFNMQPVGNIKDGSLKEIWNNKKANICRENIKTCKMPCRLLNCNFKEDKQEKKSLIKFVKSFFKGN